jgi:uncharacterized protein YyaL (SSP411 family)
MANRLAQATSPYLLQHQDNPVHWQPWDEQAFADARERDVPILLSVGYAACHWCHVMAHESFENADIAAQMNRSFVNVKVDREERPDLDQIYQHALALLGQQGGWPLTMFLSPDREPFWGGTYFPPESRYGRPGFPEVLETVSRIWRDERHRVTSNTSALKDALRGLGQPAAGAFEPGSLAAAVAKRLTQAFDTIHGGLAGAPKFPQAPLLDFLWDQALLSCDPALRHAVQHTLTNICQGGIYDHLGGGFARYSVDALWLVPHFEKMLYDNAQLLALLADVWADTADPLLVARATETVGWLEREMMVGDGFASSLDADSEGEEGRYYVWEAAEIDRLLGENAPRFRLAYGVTDAGNWEGKTVLNRLHHYALPPADEESDLAAARARLLEARAERTPPGRDDKVLADWNGLAIAALARAGSVFERPEWLELAQAAFAFVVREMADGERLSHSWRKGRRLDRAFLDDYASMARAALILLERTGSSRYRDHAVAWVDVLDRHHWDEATGGYCQADDGASDVLVRAKNAQDGPTPAGNGVMVEVLARLHLMTGDNRYRQRAEQLLAAFGGEVRNNPAVHATLLAASVLLERSVQVVVIGAPEDPATEALRNVALAAAAPGCIVTCIGPDGALPDGHPAAGKSQIDGRPTVYVCPGQTCRLPMTAPEELRSALRPESVLTWFGGGS